MEPGSGGEAVARFLDWLAPRLCLCVCLSRVAVFGPAEAHQKCLAHPTHDPTTSARQRHFLL